MDKVQAIIKRKPIFFLVISLIYIVALGFLKWQIHPTINSLYYLAGGLLGVYFLDIAEEFFGLTPSPFRSIIFAVLFVVVSLFVVTSSGSMLTAGLVLSLYLSLVLWQLGEWQINGNLNSWYRMIAAPVTVAVQKWLTVIFIFFFLAETALFLILR